MWKVRNTKLIKFSNQRYGFAMNQVYCFTDHVGGESLPEVARLRYKLRGAGYTPQVPDSTAHFLNPSHQCLVGSPSFPLKRTALPPQLMPLQLLSSSPHPMNMMVFIQACLGRS